MIDVRDHISHRINRARLQLEVKRAIPPLIVILIGGAIGLLAWGYQVNEIGEYVLKDSREVRFELRDATAIVAGGDEVRFKGIPAGRITKLETDSGRPVITASVYREYGPIYRNARATVRPNTALEDMYIDILDRGTKSAGEATKSAPVPASRTDTSEQVEAVLQTFNPPTRARLAALLRDFGGGLRDRGASLRETFVEVVPFLSVATRLTDQLASRSTETKRLVHNFHALTEELGRRDRQLRTLTRAGGATLRPVANVAPALDQTLRELPPTLAGIESSFNTVHGVLPELDRALGDLREVAQRLPEGLRGIRRLSTTARPAVAALQKPVDRLVPLIRQLVPFSDRLSQTLSTLRPQMPAIEHVIDASAHCAYPAAYGFFHHTASLTKFEDARGVFPRGDAVVSIASSNAVADPIQRPLRGCAGGLPKQGAP